MFEMVKKLYKKLNNYEDMKMSMKEVSDVLVRIKVESNVIYNNNLT